MKELLLKYKKEYPNHIVIKDQILKDFLLQLYPHIIDTSQKSLKFKATLYLNDFEESPKCNCGNILEFIGPGHAEIHVTPYGGWRKYCSRKCMYASEEVKAKRKATTFDRFGEEHFSRIQVFRPFSEEALKSFHEKSIATSQKNHGVDHYSMTPEYLEKREATCMKVHGVKNAFLLPKVKETMIARYGEDSWLKTEAADISRRTRIISSEEKLKSYLTFLLGKIKDGEFRTILIEKDIIKFQIYIREIATKNGYYCRPQIAGHVGLSTSHFNKLLRKFGMQEDYLVTNGRSFAESQITEFLKTLDVEYIVSDRTILNGKEVDVYIPKFNLGIEYDGIYYHSQSMGVYPTYHLEKTLGCEAKGIQLLHIFENEWADPIRKEIWKSMIKSKLGKITEKIGARKCEFREIAVKSSRTFLDKNHLNGFKAAEKHYGLFNNNELVSVMSVGKSYYNKEQNEITRFASKININVQGGMTKMLSNINTSNLITYADRRFSSPLNDSYSKYFSKMTTTTPNWYGICKGMELKHRLSFTKDKVTKLGNGIYDDALTIYENMLKIGIDRIWDCGNLKFSN